ncbi:MAG: hypothetical protein E6J85_13675, partial [Deltaproteobacteria bacterium]
MAASKSQGTYFAWFLAGSVLLCGGLAWFAGAPGKIILLVGAGVLIVSAIGFVKIKHLEGETPLLPGPEVMKWVGAAVALLGWVVTIGGLRVANALRPAGGVQQDGVLEEARADVCAGRLARGGKRDCGDGFRRRGRDGADAMKTLLRNHLLALSILAAGLTVGGMAWAQAPATPAQPAAAAPPAPPAAPATAELREAAAKAPAAADLLKGDPGGIITGTIADVTVNDAKAGVTLADAGNQIGQNKVAINFVWTLICGFLVMFMQAGFAMVESGLCRV